jgi:hypothetical protein
MKKLLTKIMIMGCAFCLAQNPSMQWLNSVNGLTSGDDWNAKTRKDASGNYLSTGQTNSGDAFILKTDINGNALLKLTWNSPLNEQDQGLDVCADNAGNIYLGGVTRVNNFQTPFVVKYDMNGNKIWEFVDVNVTMNNSFSAFDLDFQNNPGNIYYVGSKNDSSSATKINSNTGALVWQQQYKAYGKFNDIEVNSNGYPFVIGYHAFAGNNPDVYWAELDKNTAYPFRGAYIDGSQTDSVDNSWFATQYYDQGARIILGPAGTLAVLATTYNNFQAASVVVVKYGSTGNVPQWTYTYDSPNHTQGQGIQLIADASFTNFYYLAKASSTGGVFYTYPMIGKINSTGAQVWVKEYTQGLSDFNPQDMALDGNGNAHVIANVQNPSSDVYYLKLASTTGNIVSFLNYDNLRNGGNAQDLATTIFIDNTNHPYFFGSSNAGTYSYSDIFVTRLNTNSTLDWDVVFDFLINTSDNLSNLFVMNPSGTEYIISVGNTYNNVTNADVDLSCYSETGTVIWSVNFDYNNKYDYVVGVEKSTGNNLFMCTEAYPNLVLTEFYSDGTTNFSYQTSWNVPNPKVFGIDAGENCAVAGYNANSNDFNVGTWERNTGNTYSNTAPVNNNITSYPNDITADNSGNAFYVGGYHFDNLSGLKKHLMVQKYDLTGAKIWSKYIEGLDSSSYYNDLAKIEYDAGTNSLFITGTATKLGDTKSSTLLARMDLNGNVTWKQTYNNADARNEIPVDMYISGGYVYITGYAATVLYTDNMLYVEKWDMNGNFIWSSTYNSSVVNANDAGNSVVADASGNVFVTGTCNGPTYLEEDIITIKFDANGNQLWKKEINGSTSGQDGGKVVRLSTNFASNPRIFVSGNIQQGSGNYQDIFTLKYCDLPEENINYSGSNVICPNNSVTLNSSGNGTVTWSPGGQVQSGISASTSGSYFYNLLYSDGCTINSDTLNITVKTNPDPISLCMATVDTASTHNILYWDKTQAADAVGFKIYREDLTNIYTYIGAVPYDSLAEYHDYQSNPNVTTKRYKISVVDTCGNESAMSDFHNTIFFNGNGTGAFSWNTYTIENQSNPVSYYVLYRDDNSTGVWDSIASTAGTQNVLNDPNFSSFPFARYRVETIWSISCDPTRAVINTSRSNIKNSANNPSLGIGENLQVNASVSPNPAKDKITIALERDPSGGKLKVEIYDMLGQRLYSSALQSSSATVDLSEFASGVYFVRIMNGNRMLMNKKIVKE